MFDVLKLISHARWVLLCSLVPMTLQAGGITLYEIASADTRLASAGWSSRAEDPSTLFTNPAGMTRLCGPQIEFGAQAIYAHITFHPNNQTTVPGSAGDSCEWLPSGSIFSTYPINDSLTVGLGVLGYFGAPLDFNKDWVGRYYLTKTFLEALSIVPAVAYQLTDTLSIGVGANVMFSVFNQNSAINNFTDALPDGVLKIHDESWAAGAVVGLLYEPTSCTRLGIQYLSPVDLRFSMKPEFKGIGPLLEILLTRTGLLDSEIKTTVRVPQGIMLGAYHDFNNSWSIMGDIGWQEWSRFQKVSIALADPTSRTLTFLPKFQDTWHAGVGVEFHYNPCWTFSGGVAYDSSAVTDKNRQLDFPIGEQWRFGTGARWYYSDEILFDVSYEFQWTGNLPVDIDRGTLTKHVVGQFHDIYTQFFTLNLSWAY